jgi:hypothetical protein
MENKCNKHTMRSAFKRWLILHNEEFRTHGYIRIPHWFRHYIRNTTEWHYMVDDVHQAYYCNKQELEMNRRRRFKGHYVFEISDVELLNLERPEWLK